MLSTLKKPSTEQRLELGRFLSSRRALLRPADLGLPTMPRRTPGLRREEVAQLAGVSLSWYTWLEQGRAIQASTATLERVAKVLQLDRVERHHLFALSSRAVPPAEPDEHVSHGLHDLVQSMDPTPVYIRNARLDVLAWNNAITDVFVDYGALAPHERNTLRLLFLYPPYRQMILDWEELARGMISTFRAARARAQNRAPFDELIAELTQLSPEFRSWWTGTEVSGFEEGRKRLLHPVRGRMTFTYISLIPEGRADLSLVAYLPCREAGECGS